MAVPCCGLDLGCGWALHLGMNLVHVAGYRNVLAGLAALKLARGWNRAEEEEEEIR